jgi:ParB/RepB/Spo0J family partition protein
MKDEFKVRRRSINLFDKDKPVTEEGLRLSHIEKFGQNIVLDIPIKKIETKKQVRVDFDDVGIRKLAEDIQENGLLHPIIVMQKKDDEDLYQLLIGENRLRACVFLGQKKIKAMVYEYKDNKSEVGFIQLSENLHRKNLNPIETANAISELRAASGLKLKEIADRIGRSLDTVKAFSRISKMTDSEKEKHLKSGTSFKDLQKLLGKKKSVSDTLLMVSGTQKQDPKQLSLFSKKDGLLKIKSVKIDFEKAKRTDIEKTIKELKAAVSEAEKMLEASSKKREVIRRIAENIQK